MTTLTGSRLFTSKNTVAKQVRSILTKTNCANRTEADQRAAAGGVAFRFRDTAPRTCLAAGMAGTRRGPQVGLCQPPTQPANSGSTSGTSKLPAR